MADEGEVATLEAPAADVSVDISPSGGDVSTDTSGESSSATSEVLDNADSPTAGETDHLRGAELFKSVKEKLRKGEALTPQEFRSIRNAVHMADKADRLTGGNLESLEAQNGLLAKLDSDPDAGHTPQEIVERTVTELKGWRDFDTKFEAGDPAIVKEMLDANPEAFQKIVPAAMDEFARVNPEAFSGYVAKSTVGYLSSKQVPLQFAILDTFLPQSSQDPATQRVIEAIQAIKGAFDGLNQMASNPITPKTVAGQKTDAQGQPEGGESVEVYKIKANRAEWQSTVDRPGIELRTSEMNRVAAAQKATLDDADKQKIRAAVNEELNTRLSVDERYKQAMRGYLVSGNRKAYTERAISEQKKLVPGITRRHTQAVIDEKKAAGAQKPAATNGQPAKAAPAPVKDGSGNLIQWIADHPKNLGKSIDHSRTPHGWLTANPRKAYLTGEKSPVQWKPKTA